MAKDYFRDRLEHLGRRMKNDLNTLDVIYRRGNLSVGPIEATPGGNVRIEEMVRVAPETTIADARDYIFDHADLVIPAVGPNPLEPQPGDIIEEVESGRTCEVTSQFTNYCYRFTTFNTETRIRIHTKKVEPYDGNS